MESTCGRYYLDFATETLEVFTANLMYLLLLISCVSCINVVCFYSLWVSIYPLSHLSEMGLKMVNLDKNWLSNTATGIQFLYLFQVELRKHNHHTYTLLS